MKMNRSIYAKPLLLAVSTYAFGVAPVCAEDPTASERLVRESLAMLGKPLTRNKSGNGFLDQEGAPFFRITVIDAFGFAEHLCVGTRWAAQGGKQVHIGYFQSYSLDPRTREIRVIRKLLEPKLSWRTFFDLIQRTGFWLESPQGKPKTDGVVIDGNIVEIEMRINGVTQSYSVNSVEHLETADGMRLRAAIRKVETELGVRFKAIGERPEGNDDAPDILPDR